MLKVLQDTITAIATPSGEGGIGVVRISGPDTELLVSKVFRSAKAVLPPQMQTHRMYLGIVSHPDTGGRIDEVLCVIMHAPNSFTGETMAEFHGHGGMRVLQMILEAVLAAGSRLAEPGEFSRRAFLNGKLDLIQAEAVSDVIHAKTEFGVKVAQTQLEGRLSNAIGSLREETIGILAEVEAFLDFPEEDIPMLSKEEAYKKLHPIINKVTFLVKSADYGRVLRDGLPTAIIGRPNVGKSSLLNALLREERAIVTPIPGTTRDTIQEYVNCKGLLLRLIDTAGIRFTEDPVEQIGVARAQACIEQAEMILLVIDSSEPLTQEDKDLLEVISSKSGIVVLNKGDLPSGLIEPDKALLADYTSVKTSIIKKWGIDSLESEICKKPFMGSQAPEGEIVSNVRHKDALLKALQALNKAAQTLKSAFPIELVTVDLRDAAEALGLITGENITEELLDLIFSKFCIGK